MWIASNRSLRQLIRKCVVLLTVGAFISGCSTGLDTWQRIQDDGTLRIGLDPTYPPFESLEGNELQGIDKDLADAMASDLGLEAQFSYFGYDGLYDALMTKQVDVLLSALVVFPERTKDFSYTSSYFDAGQVLVLRTGENSGDPDKLTNVTIAVELGSEGHTIANQMKRTGSGLVVTTYRSLEESLEAVANFEADVAIVDSVSGRLFASETTTLTASDLLLTSEPYALVVRSGDKDLLEHLNTSLDRLRKNGDIDLIMDKWLGGFSIGSE